MFKRKSEGFLKDKIFNNEDEIKQCEIKINEQVIPFNYIHKFESSGKYTIKYLFKNNIKNTAYMFYKCELLNSINFSNFNTNNVTNMSYIFYKCSSLNSINLSNFNTNKVKNVNGMFNYCKNLKKENISIKDEKTLKRILKELK